MITCPQCANDTRDQRDNVLQFIKTHPLMDAAVKQKKGHPMFHQGGVIFRNIAVDIIRDYKVFFLGTGMYFFNHFLIWMCTSSIIPYLDVYFFNHFLIWMCTSSIISLFGYVLLQSFPYLDVYFFNYFLIWLCTSSIIQLGDIQVLHNTVGGGRVSDFHEKSITNRYSSTLLVLRGGGWVSNFRGKSVT